MPRRRGGRSSVPRLPRGRGGGRGWAGPQDGTWKGLVNFDSDAESESEIEREGERVSRKGTERSVLREQE